ncbi:MAG: hypothetical protein LUB62_02175, partial [Prevotellaceae bacterium]|nr:hypothetical protein [Prevotellaceae bacterium]
MTTKNFLRLMTPVAIAAVSCAVLSCSDDDDKAGENINDATAETIDTSGSTPVSPVIATLEGNRLALRSIKTSNGTEWSFTYDDDWLCSSFSYGGHDSFSVSYNPCVMTYSDGAEEVEMQVWLNSAGYASKIVVNSTDSYGESEQATYQLVYDAGCLTQVSVSTIWDEGQAYSSSASTFTWEEGNLTGVKTNGVEMDPEDGGMYYYDSEWSFKYGDEQNTYRQFTVAQAKVMEEELADDFEYLSSLCFMGLLGKGTANLPTSVAYSESDESGTEINSSGIAYTLNSNGTIEKETVYGRQFTYSYQTEGEGSELAREYFSIEGATYLSGDFPQSTTNAEIQGLTLNSQALSGGFNFVTIVSETTYRKFFVGVKGVSGYYEYEAMSESGGSDYNSYMIPISYSEDY